MRPLSSAADFRVKVMATVSEGRRPGHASIEVRSRFSARNEPWPESGVRGPQGVTWVARCSEAMRC